MKIIRDSDFTQNYGMVLIYCNSTETKPTLGIVNASMLYEMDTKKYYCFDEDGQEWKEITVWTAGEGGGGEGGDPGYGTDVTYYLKDAEIGDEYYSNYGWNFDVGEEPISIDEFIGNYSNIVVEVDGTIFRFTNSSNPYLDVDFNEQIRYSGATFYGDNFDSSVDLECDMLLETNEIFLSYYGGYLVGESDNPPQTISIYRVVNDVDEDFKAAVESCYTEPSFVGTWYQYNYFELETKGTPDDPFLFATSDGFSSNLSIYPRTNYVGENNIYYVLLDGEQYCLFYNSDTENYILTEYPNVGEACYELYYVGGGWDYYEIKNGTRTLEDSSHTLAIYTQTDSQPAPAFQSAVEKSIEAPYDIIIKSNKQLGAAATTVDNLTLVRGTYADCMKKISNGGYLKAKVYSIEYGDGGYIGYQDYQIYGIYADQNYNDNVSIYTSVDIYQPFIGVRNSADNGSQNVYGASGAYAVFTLTESGLDFQKLT